MRRRRWPAAEITTVLSRYPAEGPATLAAELGRSEHSVHGLARRFGLRTPRKRYRSSARTRPTALREPVVGRHRLAGAANEPEG